MEKIDLEMHLPGDVEEKNPELFHSLSGIGNVTLLLGGLAGAIDEFISSGLTRLGYNTHPLPVPQNTSMETGKEFCDGGLCNPTYYTVGNLIGYLDNLRLEGLSKQEIIDNYAFITAGSCGPCRFGMYEAQYENALKKAGYSGFRLVIFQTSAGGSQEQSKLPGLKLNVEFFRAILNGIMLGDALNTMKYKVLPYEINKGETEKVYQECKEIINNTLKTAPREYIDTIRFNFKPTEYLWNAIDQIRSTEIKKTLKLCRKKIGNISVNYMVAKPKIKITGEFWAAMTEGDGNYKMYDFLHEEGCEILVESCGNWLFYLLWLQKSLNKDKLGSERESLVTWRDPIKYPVLWVKYILKQTVLNIAILFYKWNYAKFANLMGGFAGRVPSMKHLAKLSGKYINTLYEGGEGHMEVAKNIYYTKNKLSHMVLSIKPFGCMPSTISDSVQAKVVKDFDVMNFLPLETSGDGRINALSRVQMALGEARELMTLELEEVLSKFGYKLKDWKSIQKEYSKPMSALTPVTDVKGYTMQFSKYFHYT